MLDPTKSDRFRTPRRLLALAAAAAITLAACGDDDDDTPAAAATTEAASPATAVPATNAGGRGDYDYGASGDSASTAAPAAGSAAVMVADSSLGKILTGANGMTVYLFMPDAQGTPTCASTCAQAWPPLTVADAASLTGGDGLDASLLGTAEHPEAGTQVTYNGWPLYYYAADSAPGDTNGQGTGGVWYVVDPTGNPIDND